MIVKIAEKFEKIPYDEYTDEEFKIYLEMLLDNGDITTKEYDVMLEAGPNQDFNDYIDESWADTENHVIEEDNKVYVMIEISRQ